MSKQTIIKGTLVLTITGILTKCLGFYNRIFLTRLIGVKELGTYQLIFPLYILGISFCCQGIATTITKHVSYLLGKKNDFDSRRVLWLGGLLSFTLSLLVSASFFYGCDEKYGLPYPVAASVTGSSICRNQSLYQRIFYRTRKTGFLRKLSVNRADYPDRFGLSSCNLLHAGACRCKNRSSRCCDWRDGGDTLCSHLLHTLPQKSEPKQQTTKQKFPSINREEIVPYNPNAERHYSDYFQQSDFYVIFQF